MVTVKWNVEVMDDKGRKGVLESFITSRPVRMNTIHNFVKTLIDNDVNDIRFDIYKNDTEFDMFIERNFSTGGSVVRIVDPLSQMREKQYEVRFARQNRPPALFYIDQESLGKSDKLLGNCKGATISFSGNKFKVSPPLQGCAVDFSFNVSALDPDEEPVSLSVNGPTGIPHTLTAQDIASPFPCIHYTVTASDGNAQDWQRINLRLKSKQYSPKCVQN